MKHVFLDCGFHHGEGLSDFSSRFGIDGDWLVYAFEANPECFALERASKRFQFEINVIEAAVWVSDGRLSFRQEDHTRSNTHSPTDGRSSVDGHGSCVEAVHSAHPALLDPISIPCFDFSRFLRDNFRRMTHRVICKLDIEGAEFPVLRKLISDGTLGIMDLLYVEFHERFLPEESAQSKADLLAEARRHTTVIEWR